MCSTKCRDVKRSEAPPPIHKGGEGGPKMFQWRGEEFDPFHLQMKGVPTHHTLLRIKGIGLEIHYSATVLASSAKAREKESAHDQLQRNLKCRLSANESTGLQGKST